MKLKKWQAITLWLLGTAGITYGMIYVDVVHRAKESYLEGEKFTRWADHPEERTQVLSDQFEKDKAALDAKQAKGQVSAEDYARELDLLKFAFGQSVQESSAKYAYLWYQTTVELFSPPESKWVVMAREKLPVAKERWIRELKAKKIPFEDYMVE